jgi:hypothetical protein
MQKKRTGEGVGLDGEIIGKRVLFGDETEYLVVGTMVAEVALKAAGESGFTCASSVVLDEEEAFHVRVSGFEFRDNTIIAIIIIKKKYLIFHKYHEMARFDPALS